MFHSCAVFSPSFQVSREKANADAEPHLSSREKFERMVRDSQDEEDRRSQQRSLGMPHHHRNNYNRHGPAPVIGFQAYRQTRSRGYSSDGEERSREQQRRLLPLRLLQSLGN